MDFFEKDSQVLDQPLPVLILNRDELGIHMAEPLVWTPEENLSSDHANTRTVT